MQKIDLHIHSTCSDGILSPKEIIDIASEGNMETISITDHDSIEAYTKEFCNYAKEKNITLIPGVEISTQHTKCGIHLLGYNFDLQNKELIENIKNLKLIRLEYLTNVTEKLNELGYIVEKNYLESLETVTKGQISNNVINNKNNRELLIKNFGYIPNMGEFIETIMNKGCPAYVKKNTITPLEASKLIKNAGGKVFLAHPIVYFYEKGINEEDIINLLKEINADGIETNYIFVNSAGEIKNDIGKWNQIAKDTNLFTSIGSDFHNDDNIRPLIGFKNYKLDITEDEIQTIMSNILD